MDDPVGSFVYRHPLVVLLVIAGGAYGLGRLTIRSELPPQFDKALPKSIASLRLVRDRAVAAATDAKLRRFNSLDKGAKFYGEANAAVNATITRISVGLAIPDSISSDEDKRLFNAANAKLEAFFNWYNQTRPPENTAATDHFTAGDDVGDVFAAFGVIAGIMQLNEAKAQAQLLEVRSQLKSCEWPDWVLIDASK